MKSKPLEKWRERSQLLLAKPKSFDYDLGCAGGYIFSDRKAPTYSTLKYVTVNV